VEAIRLLVERTEDISQLFPVFLSCLKGPTKREREGILYYLSRLGKPEHIPAIEASAEGMDEHFEYSIKCTINQIRERAREGEK
jgi:hypothetical protein